MVSRKEAEKKTAEILGVKDRVIVLSKFTPVPFAEEILSNLTLVYDKNKIFWRYDKEKGIWVANTENYLRNLIRQKLLGDSQQEKRFVEEILSYLKDITFDEQFVIDNNPYLIAFENTVYDLRDGQFKDFSPEYHITNKIPITLNGEKECPTIDKFFEDCVGKEYKDILYDLPAYCLFRRQPYQKLFFIFGAAGTGKSQYLGLIESFLGDKNFSSIEPQKIQTDPYSGAQMWLKSANIVSDINYDALENVNQIKKMTGGDTLTVREIYKAPFQTKLYAKQIFSTNKLPIVKEKTRAWYRRVYLIPFYNIIEKEKDDPFILEKMKNELSGFAYKCLEHLKNMKEYKFRFTYDINIEEMASLYEELSNPILRFINENCEVHMGNSDYWVFKWEFKERLLMWLKNNHYPLIGNSQINEYMKEFYNESNRQSFNGDKTYRVWVGLKWVKTPENKGLLNHFNHFNGVMKRVYIYRDVFPTQLNPLNPLNEDIQSNERRFK